VGVETPIRYRYAFGEILFITLSETIRRDSTLTEKSLWRLAKSAFSQSAQTELFDRDQPIELLKSCLRASVSHGELKFIHRFGDPDTPEWYSSFTAQFGFTCADLDNFAELVRDPQQRTAISFLLKRSPRFSSFWNTCLTLLASATTEAEIRQELENSPFVLPEWQATLSRQLVWHPSERRYAVEDGLRTLSQASTEVYKPAPVITSTILWPSDSQPFIKLQINFARLVALLPETGDVQVSVNGQYKRRLFRDHLDHASSVRGSDEVRIDLLQAGASVLVSFDVDQHSHLEEVRLWDETEIVSIFEQPSGENLIQDSLLKVGRTYLFITPPNITLQPADTHNQTSKFSAYRYTVTSNNATIQAANLDGIVFHEMGATSNASRSMLNLHDIATVRPKMLEQRTITLDQPVDFDITLPENLNLLAVRIGNQMVRPSHSTLLTNNWKVQKVSLGLGLTSSIVPVQLVIKQGEKILRYKGLLEQLPILGAQINNQGTWQTVYKKDIFSSEILDHSALKIFTGKHTSGVLYDGFRPITPTSERGFRLRDLLDGWGEKVSVWTEAVNGKKIFTVAYTAVRNGLIDHLQTNEETGKISMKLRRPDDLGGYLMTSWSPLGGFNQVEAQDVWHPVSTDSTSVFELDTSAQPNQSQAAPLIYALSFRGDWIGSWWHLGDPYWYASLNNMDQIAGTPASTLIAWLRWCHFPFLSRALSRWFIDLLCARPEALSDLLNSSEVDIDGTFFKQSASASMMRAVRKLVDANLQEFRAAMERPDWLTYWDKPASGRLLCQIHPKLYTHLFELFASRPPRHEFERLTTFETIVSPELNTWLGTNFDRHFVELSVKDWLMQENPPATLNQTIHAFLCKPNFAKWLFDGLQ